MATVMDSFTVQAEGKHYTRHHPINIRAEDKDMSEDNHDSNKTITEFLCENPGRDYYELLMEWHHKEHHGEMSDEDKNMTRLLAECMEKAGEQIKHKSIPNILDKAFH